MLKQASTQVQDDQADREKTGAIPGLFLFSHLRAGSSKHPVLMGAVFREFLKHIPMFDNLASLIQPEDINASVFQALRPDLVAVKDNMIALGQSAFNLHALARILRRHLSKISDEPFLA